MGYFRIQVSYQKEAGEEYGSAAFNCTFEGDTKINLRSLGINIIADLIQDAIDDADEKTQAKAVEDDLKTDPKEAADGEDTSNSGD